MEDLAYFHEKLTSVEKAIVSIQNSQERSAQAIETLARVEERQVAAQESMAKMFAAQNELFRRLRAVENIQVGSVIKLGYGEKFMYSIGGIIASIIAGITVWVFKQ